MGISICLSNLVSAARSSKWFPLVSNLGNRVAASNSTKTTLLFATRTPNAPRVLCERVVRAERLLVKREGLLAHACRLLGVALVVQLAKACSAAAAVQRALKTVDAKKQNERGAGA